MKKIITLFLVLTMLLTLAACGEPETKELNIGTTNYSILIPEGYNETNDDFAEDQIAYYYKNDKNIDFDIYQWDKGDDYTLESEAEHFADQYGTKPESIEINGITVMKYISEEEYEGYVYTVVNYMFEDEDNIVELSFWTIDTDDEYAAVDDIINTLKYN